MKFEIGDWIECNYANGTRIIAQVSSENMVKENGVGDEYPTSFSEGSGWVEWKPVDMELCWFQEIHEDGSVFPERPFLDSHCGNYQDGNSYCSDSKMCGNSYWNSCEPFFGKLPFSKGN